MKYPGSGAKNDRVFDDALAARGLAPLVRGEPRTLQVNVGKVCNQACHHCHVDAGPNRTERMERPVAERVIEVLAASPRVEALDLTGGAPELNADFRYLVESACSIGRRVMVRCNLTVILVLGMEWLPAFYRQYRVDLVCSLSSARSRATAPKRGRATRRRRVREEYRSAPHTIINEPRCTRREQWPKR